MIAYSLLASFSVLLVALVMQWLIYRDWLHETGPVRIVGTTIAALLTFGFVLNWQARLHKQQAENLRRFQRIAEMNDRIRNALQAIECLAFAQNREPIAGIREAVSKIAAELNGVVEDSRPVASGIATAKDPASVELAKTKSRAG